MISFLIIKNLEVCQFCDSFINLIIAFDELANDDESIKDFENLIAEYSKLFPNKKYVSSKEFSATQLKDYATEFNSCPCVKQDLVCLFCLSFINILESFNRLDLQEDLENLQTEYSLRTEIPI